MENSFKSSEPAIEEIERYKLLGSLLEFTQVFYTLRTGRLFKLSTPFGRESHYLQVFRALVRVLNGETNRLIINIPPRYGKTEMLIHFISWALANYPDSNFIYVSYSHSLAKKQTQTIKEIITLPHYRKILGVNLKADSTAKDNFETTAGGSVYAVGSGGTITGRGAGIKGTNRFGGIICLDDMIKPDEATSDTIRENINNWYYNTLQSRLNSPETPIVFIGQRLHEDDLAANLIRTGDWETLIIPALDENKHALHTEMHTSLQLLKMQKESPYEFASQYQQNPQPSGGGIFKPEWFYLTDEYPEMLATFITADTAETDKDYNDATIFSFWGIYKIKENDEFGLHWINCVELRIEPKDLESEFMSFYSDCLRFNVKPKMAAIEKKSTGVTLISVLKKVRGLQIREISRTKASGNKTARFIEIQPFVASGNISINRNAKHTNFCLEHMRKITANNTHRFDDIADTLYDAIKIALIDKLLNYLYDDNKSERSQTAKKMMSTYNKVQALKKAQYSKRN